MNLADYQSEIRRYHRQAQVAADSAINNALAAGKLLIKAKAEVQHGEWLPFLESTDINARTAQRYMQLANNERLLKNDSVSHFSVTKALEYLTENRINPPQRGCYLYLSQGERTLWVWPYESDYFHYAEVIEADDGECDIRTSKRAMRMEGVKWSIPDVGLANLQTGIPYEAIAYRDSAMTGTANHGDGFDPAKPCTSPSLVKQIGEVVA